MVHGSRYTTTPLVALGGRRRCRLAGRPVTLARPFAAAVPGIATEAPPLLYATEALSPLYATGVNSWLLTAATGQQPSNSLGIS